MTVFLRCVVLGCLTLGLIGCGSSAASSSSSQARPEAPSYVPPPPGIGALNPAKRTPDQVAADIGADKTSKENVLTGDGEIIVESGTYEVTIRTGVLGTGDQRVGDTSTVWLVRDDGRRWLLPEPWAEFDGMDGERVRVTGSAVEMEVPEFRLDDWEPIVNDGNRWEEVDVDIDLDD